MRHAAAGGVRRGFPAQGLQARQTRPLFRLQAAAFKPPGRLFGSVQPPQRAAVVWTKNALARRPRRLSRIRFAPTGPVVLSLLCGRQTDVRAGRWLFGKECRIPLQTKSCKNGKGQPRRACRWEGSGKSFARRAQPRKTRPSAKAAAPFQRAAAIRSSASGSAGWWASAFSSSLREETPIAR